MLRTFLKRTVLGIFVCLLSPAIALTRIACFIGLEDVFAACGMALSLIPGKIGSYSRLAFYKGTVSRISSDVFIGFCSFISKRSAEIGSNVTVGAFSIIGSAVIGDNVLISSRVSIMSGKKQHGDLTGNVDSSHSPRYERISIGAGSWIGENAVVMAEIGEKCIVSAGSVVTRKMPDNCLAVGNPARPLKRSEGDRV